MYQIKYDWHNKIQEITSVKVGKDGDLAYLHKQDKSQFAYQKCQLSEWTNSTVQKWIY